MLRGHYFVELVAHQTRTRTRERAGLGVADHGRADRGEHPHVAGAEFVPSLGDVNAGYNDLRNAIAKKPEWTPSKASSRLTHESCQLDESARHEPPEDVRPRSQLL